MDPVPWSNGNYLQANQLATQTFDSKNFYNKQDEDLKAELLHIYAGMAA